MAANLQTVIANTASPLMENIGVMSEDGVEEVSANKTMGVRKSEQAEESIERREPLLPGIPNEITINLIATKLPWTAFHILSSVSRPWQQAIRSHEVYDARVRSKSTQPLVPLRDRSDGSKIVRTITLFSPEDGSYYHLPPIPSINEKKARSCRFVFLDGKLYVLEGLVPFGNNRSRGCAEVYVFDLVRQREWKQCASLGNARYQCGCGVKDGKIYVFGGCDRGPGDYVHGSEVYDPTKDAWFPISPVPSPGLGQKVATVGDELFVHSTRFFYNDLPRSTGFTYGSCAEVYHPVTDKWRIVENFIGTRSVNHVDVVLTVGGKLHKLTQFGLQVFDIQSSLWKPTQPLSFGACEATHSFRVDPLSAVEVNDEILALVLWTNKEEPDSELFFIRSQGVGAENKQILWQKLQCSLSRDNDLLSCLIQI